MPLDAHETDQADPTGFGTPARTWNARAKFLLKAEMARRNMTYRELAARLDALGYKEPEVNLRNKVSRGGFSAGFLLKCLTAIGVDALPLGTDMAEMTATGSECATLRNLSPPLS